VCCNHLTTNSRISIAYYRALSVKCPSSNWLNFTYNDLANDYVEKTMKESPKFLTTLVCLHCGREFAPQSSSYVCACRSNQGSDLGVLDVQYDYAAIQRTLSPLSLRNDPDRSIGRYWPLLPIHNRQALPPLPVGNTPLSHAQRLGATLNLPYLYLKDDGRNPSASLKDRASAIAVARAQAEQFPVVATASTGNAAAALAMLAAAAGQPNVIFVPKTAPAAKIAQLLVHGSTVLAIDGAYDQAYDLCLEVCHEFGWYNRNTGYNPFMTEGKKTVAFEIAEQLTMHNKRASGVSLDADAPPLQAPDAVFVSVGDGCILGGVHKGFQELLTLGWIERAPRLYGVQSTQSAAIYQAWRSGQTLPTPVQATTRADSISVDAPRDALKALRAAQQSNGAILAVPDEALLAAILPLARLGAVFAEPAGATAFAGLVQAVQSGLVQSEESIVVINTGNGLKDVQAAMQVAGGATIIEPTLRAVKRLLNIDSIGLRRLTR
jgi:threonine synthase